MKKILRYNDKVITLISYNTLIERDLLLYTSNDYEFETLMDLVKDNIIVSPPYSYEDLSYNEKLNILLELRNGSVGEVFSFIKKCDKCGEKYEAEVSFNNVIEEGTLSSYKGMKVTEAFSNDYNNYVDFDIDELDIDLYDELIKYIDDNKTKFNFKTMSKCDHCGYENEIEIKESHLVENLSDDTLSNFYQSISNMVYYGNYTKLDIDSMLPFERSIYLSLLNAEIKKAKPGEI